MVLLLTVFMFAYIIPVQVAQAVYVADGPPASSTAGSDVQQLERYIDQLNLYLGSIDSIFGTQTVSAVKQFQAQYGSGDAIPGESTVNTLPQLATSAPPTAITPSRGAISRASLLRSSQDLESLARTIHGEARGESFEGQVGVAAVILNRVESGQFGNSIQAVIFQPGAFTALRDGQYYLQPTPACYEAASAALNGWDPTNGAVYYWNPVTATSRWIRTRTVICTIGNHVFGI
jgi:N-acetylmuramoyl-L-alanine amidase